MSISVRQADLEADSRELLDTLQANLPQLPHARYFEWLYRRSPEGRAAVWVATEADSGRMIGIAAAFPRRVYCSGREATGYVLGDFCVVPEYRSLGLALTLQRACLAGLAQGGARFVLDFPSEGMLAVYRRLRIDANETMVRHAKPLGADRKIAERIPIAGFARRLAVVANGGLRLRDAGTVRRTALTIAVEAGPWGEEFTRAARVWSSGLGTCVARTADYLNWRYREHPLRRYEMLAARGGDNLRGYLLQHMDGVDCTIDDLMAENDAVRRDLLVESIAVARGRRVQTLSAPWLSSHPGGELLRKCGFRRRESCPVVLVSWPGVSSEAKSDSRGWYLSHGDWER